MSHVLEGIRVIEFGPYAALPLGARLLASFGAEVIKVETHKFLDQSYFIPNEAPGANQLIWHPGKLRVSLDIRDREGKEIFEKLIKKSDVLMTNFSMPALKRWGVDFELLQKSNPGLIVLWQAAFGYGPYLEYKMYGNLVQNGCGLTSITGLPDNPAITTLWYSDYHNGVFNAIAVIAALDRRRRTGEGTIIDTSIYEAAVVTMGLPILEYQVNKTLRQPIGNRHPFAAPHNAYPCKGEDEWCVIAVFSDEEWQNLCAAMGNPSWAVDPEFATLVGRLAHQDELDQHISQWTSQYTHHEVMEKLQQAGIASGVVMKGEDLVDCPQLQSRGFYKEMSYYVPEAGKRGEQWEERRALGPLLTPVKFLQTPPKFERLHRLGEDNEYVFRELLQMSDNEIEGLREKGILE